MIRRGPTRIVLKLEDLEEFENYKRELLQKRKEKEDAEGQGQGSETGTEIAATTAESLSLLDPKARQERIQERIGYDPRPVPAASNRIGEIRE